MVQKKIRTKKRVEMLIQNAPRVSLRLPLRDLKRIGNSVPRHNRSLQQRSSYKGAQQALLAYARLKARKRFLGRDGKNRGSARERSGGVGVVGKTQHLQHLRDILVKKVGGASAATSLIGVGPTSC